MRRARLSVALLPDLCQIRQVSLPPLREDERRQVIARHVARHFPGVSVPQALGTALAPEGGLIVATAPLAVVEGIEQATAAMGWHLAGIRPAEAAWAVAGEAESPGVERVVVALADRVEVLQAQRGSVTAVRRIPNVLADAKCRAQLTQEPSTVTLVSPEALAAAFADRTGNPAIVSAARWEGGRLGVRRLTRRFAAAACVLLLLSAGVQWWGAERALAMLRAERAADAPDVAEALGRRQEVARLREQYALLRPDGPGARRWSQVLSVVADRLPRTAYLTVFRGTGDSLALEGVAREAGPVLDALREAPSVAALRATAPIRRETRNDGTAVERFALGARLVPAGERR